MKAFQFIALFFFLFGISCNNNSPHSTHIGSLPPFILASSELRVLKDDSCNKIIDTDSLNTITQFDSIKYEYHLDESNFNRPICLTFNFMADVNDGTQKVSVQLIPKNYNAVATTIPRHSFLWVEIADSNTIAGITGNEHYFDGQGSPDSLSNYVKRLFLNKPDTTRYGQKFVNLFFPDNSFHLADKYLTQIVIGYIQAQRQICMLRFGKDLKDATAEEIAELKATTPLIFKIKQTKK